MSAMTHMAEALQAEAVEVPAWKGAARVHSSLAPGEVDMPLSSWKTCTKCGCSKPRTLEYFYSRPDSRDGLRPECKECWGRMPSTQKKRRV